MQASSAERPARLGVRPAAPPKAASLSHRQRLRRLAQTGGQVLVVTHSPQVAAMGQTHWKISKTSSGKATSTHVAELSASDRREEIARMLAGAAITDISRKAADELLKGADEAAA